MTDEKPKLKDAPGLVWKPRKFGYEARWQARSDLAKRGYEPKSAPLGTYGLRPMPAEAKEYVQRQCQQLQAKMLEWAKACRQKRQYNKPTTLDWIKAHANHDSGRCLIWPFFRDPIVGYGRLCVGTLKGYAHRVMCEVAHGAPPSSKHVAAHSCGNGHLGCVNPRHLSWKTPSGNARDRIAHGRQVGNPHGGAIMTAEQIADVQTRQLSQTAYAEKYGVARSTVQAWQYKNRPPRRLASRVTFSHRTT